MARRHRNIANGENTVIGAGTVIAGDINSDSMVIRIDGKVDGRVTTLGDLIVGAKGKVSGNVSAASLILAGEIDGNVNAAHKITIEAGGKLIGDINTELLAMDETAILQGRVNMIIPDNKEDIAESAINTKNTLKKEPVLVEETKVEEAEENE